MLVEEAEIHNIAAAWARLQHIEKSKEREELFWAWDRLSELVRHDPECARKVIEAIRLLDGTDEVLANLAAGPLEDLLVNHGDRFIDRVETLSRQDRQFRKLLGAVWQNTMPDALWARVKAVAGPTW